MIVAPQLLPIERQSSDVRIGSTIDPFLGRVFPQAGFAARDLANLSFEVDEVSRGQVFIDGKPLTVVRTPSGGASRGGWLTVVDNTAVVTVELDEAQAGRAADRRCWVPRNPVGLFNLSHLLLSRATLGAMAAPSRLEIRIRPHIQAAFGLGAGVERLHVLTVAPDAYAPAREQAQLSALVHRVGVPDSAGEDWTTAVDLAQPSRYLPRARPSAADLHMNGVIQDVCVAGPARQAASRSAAAGPANALRSASANL